MQKEGDAGRIQKKVDLRGIQKKIKVARVLSLIVALSWAYGLVYFAALVVLALFITPWELGDVLVVTALPYFAAFFVPVVPSFLVFRHLGEMAYAVKKNDVKLFKQLDSTGWIWVELIFGLLVPLFMVYVTGIPVFAVDAMAGFRIPRLVPVTLKGEMTVGGAILSIPTAYVMQSVHSDAAAL